MTITTSRPAPLDIDALRDRFAGTVIGPGRRAATTRPGPSCSAASTAIPP